MTELKPKGKAVDNRPENTTVHVAGAGLAGSECALQLARLGYNVVLIEMRDEVMTPAHTTNRCAELVCSNSFGSLSSTSAPGQLKWEAEQLGSFILEAALDARVPAGQALGMDRDMFAAMVTDRVSKEPLIRREIRVVRSLDELPRPCVVATGPLTHADLARSMQNHFGDKFLYFFDAIAPIISADSINMNIAWRADRWDKGTKDYINCPLSKNDYYFLIGEMKLAKKIESKDFEKTSPESEDTPYFDGCMPIEAMLERGDLTPRFGPMSPKGLKDPRTGNNPFAVVQLRQENREATAYNIVGFQTKMAYADQKRVLRLIPGLEDADFLKLGSMHRNLYINTPKCLNNDLSSKADPWLFFAGQITGVEGYFESTCMGMMVARFLDAKVRGQLALDAVNIHGDANHPSLVPSRATAMGSLLNAITDETKIDHFQPTNINFGHMPKIGDDEAHAAAAAMAGSALSLSGRPRRLDKNQRRSLQVANAKVAMLDWLKVTGQRPMENSKVEEASRAILASATGANPSVANSEIGL